MDIIFYTRNVNYLKLHSVLAETFYLGFIILYACAPFIYHGLLWMIINNYAALVNTTHGFIGYGMFYMPNGRLSLEGCEDTEVR
jgi:hypothetical protein